MLTAIYMVFGKHKKYILLLVLFLFSCTAKEYKVVDGAKKIEFGSQDGEKISWTVISEDEKNMTLFSDDILDAREFESISKLKTEEDFSFATSDICEYLNSDFINICFSKKERERLVFINEYDDVLVTLISLDNLIDLDLGEIDYIQGEYYNNDKYFSANEKIIAKPTKQALYNDIEVFDNETFAEIMEQKKVDTRYDFANGHSPYWTVNIADKGLVYTVTSTGYIEPREADSLYIGVRPVIKIKKEGNS